MPPLLTTLGLFIIDENQYPASSGREAEYNIIGGGASYAIIGGRIAAGYAHAARITGIIDKGRDFPPEIEGQIRTWNTGVIFRDTKDRLTTRGANVYGEDGVRRFIYRTPKKRIEAKDILDTSDLLSLRSFHFCCSVERCRDTIETFLYERANRGLGGPRPQFIFEPDPRACVAESYPSLLLTLPLVDVFSPNLHEAAQLCLAERVPETPLEIETLARRFLQYTPKHGGIVLRCGHLGCFIQTHSMSIMLPAYHTSQEKVVDVTGGGNSFCGAFMTALELCSDWLAAGIVASIASGIVIENLGMPTVEDEDTWNGISFKQRLTLYLARNKELLSGFDPSVIDWH